MDKPWWEAHLDEVNRDFLGQKYSTAGGIQGVAHLQPPFTGYGNSGAACIAIAAHGGAKRVVMLGYDCQHTGGAAHWHGNHPRGLSNAKQTAKWPVLFQRLRDDWLDVEILNASRATALKVFPRCELEEALCES